MERVIEQYIAEHKEDFINGETVKYIKDNMIIPGYTENAIIRALPKFCNKKRVSENNQKLTYYFLKQRDLIPESYKQIEQTNEIEKKPKLEFSITIVFESKYSKPYIIEFINETDSETDTEPTEKMYTKRLYKTVKRELNEFFTNEYKKLPIELRPRDLLKYYNKTHQNKATADIFINAWPSVDY